MITFVSAQEGPATDDLMCMKKWSLRNLWLSIPWMVGCFQDSVYRKDTIVWYAESDISHTQKKCGHLHSHVWLSTILGCLLPEGLYNNRSTIFLMAHRLTRCETFCVVGNSLWRCRPQARTTPSCFNKDRLRQAVVGRVDEGNVSSLNQ